MCNAPITMVISHIIESVIREDGNVFFRHSVVKVITCEGDLAVDCRSRIITIWMDQLWPRGELRFDSPNINFSTNF